MLRAWPSEAGGERVARRPLDQHAGADDVEGVLLRVLAGRQLARRRLDLEFLDDAAVELHVLRLAADLVEVVDEVHAEARSA